MSLTFIFIYDDELNNLSTYQKIKSLFSLFICEAFDVKKYYYDVDVWINVFMWSQNDGFCKW